jgi:hypothetical protein
MGVSPTWAKEIFQKCGTETQKAQKARVISVFDDQKAAF